MRRPTTTVETLARRIPNQHAQTRFCRSLLLGYCRCRWFLAWLHRRRRRAGWHGFRNPNHWTEPLVSILVPQLARSPPAMVDGKQGNGAPLTGPQSPANPPSLSPLRSISLSSSLWVFAGEGSNGETPIEPPPPSRALSPFFSPLSSKGLRPLMSFFF